MRRKSRRSVAGPRKVLAAALCVVLVPLAAVPVRAAAAPATGGGGSDPASASVGTSSTPVTLVTGDTVAVSRTSATQYAAQVTHVARRSGGFSPTFTTLGAPDGRLYVIPDDAAPAIAAGTLDRELFDVARLVADGFADAQTSAVPVILQYASKVGTRSLAPSADALPATSEVTGLPTINGAALAVAKSGAATFWSALFGTPTTAGSKAAAAAVPKGGITKVWLDGKAHVTLDQSVPQIGAPQAWAAGYTGAGVKVAVLDTGVDDTHPDLAGRIAEERSFVDGVPSAKDGHGHGTHVASTIVGSGAASGGRYKGVAPGADLLIGKVMNDDGTGSDSDIIAGMDWAAHSGARIISMSLGTDGPSDGTDPMSQAANELTEQTGALFVIAAGNAGGESTIGGPGAATDALTVAAVDKQDRLAYFSSRGPVLGTYGLKPDIAAPGVDITAARAAGTAHGTPVDDYYTTMSGTSMATPHVSGSAAILAQVHPDWTASQLKAALMATAKDDGYTPYEQGTGRVDVPHAIEQVVVPDTASVDFAAISNTATDPVTRTVTVHNRGTVAANLAVTPHINGPGGQPSTRITVSPASLTVPAGGSAELTLTIDPASADRGRYSGSIQLTGDGAGQSVRLTVGAVVTPPSHVLRLHAEPPAGWPSPRFVAVFPAPWVLVPVDRPDDFILVSGGVDQQATVPDGVYAVWTDFTGYFDPTTGEEQAAVLVDPEVKVLGGDAQVSLDANQTRPVTVQTDRASHQDVAALGIARGTGYGGAWVISDLFGYGRPWGATGTSLRINPTQPVTVGSLTTVTGFFASQPLVSLTVGGSRQQQGQVFAPTYPDADFESPWTDKLDLRGSVDLVDVGRGTPEDLAGHDLHGKIAVLSRNYDDYDIGTLDYLNDDRALAMLSTLRDAGAIAAITFVNSEGRPGWCALGCDPAMQNRHTAIPVLTLGPGEGAALRAALHNGVGRATIDARPKADYNYVLRFRDDSGVVHQAYRARQNTLSTVDTRYHADVPGYALELFSTVAPDGVNLFMPRYTATPAEATQYIGPADPSVLWQRRVIAQAPDADDVINILIAEPWETYPRPVQRTVDLFASPSVPGAVVRPQGMLDRWQQDALCQLCRDGDFFRVYNHDTWSAPDQGGEIYADTEAHLYRNGTEVTPTAPGVPVFNLAGYPEPARYRLTLSRSTLVTLLTHGIRVDTAWEYDSQAPAQGAPRGYSCYAPACRVEPMLLLGYDLSGAIGLDNTAATPGAARFTIRAYHQAWAPDPRVTRLTLSVSYDHGAHWVPASAIRSGNGTFEALVVHPLSTSGTVSLHVEAADAAGNTVTQTVYDAYGLAPRGAYHHG